MSRILIVWVELAAGYSKMSGRDWKKLIAHHRGIPFQNQIQNLKGVDLKAAGSPHYHFKTYTKVDYDSVLSSIKREKEKSNEQMLRVKKLKRQSKDSKEASNLKEHQLTWSKMCTILNKQVIEQQLEIEKWRSQCILNDDSIKLKNFMLEVMELFNTQMYNQVQFEHDSHEPVKTLQNKLREFRKAKLEDLPKSFSVDILNEISKVREEKERVWSLLEEEWLVLDGQLQTLSLELLPRKREDPIEGVPEEVWSLDCPSLELREMMSEEFLKLDRHYTNQLNDLFIQFETQILLTNGGWDLENDRMLFELVYAQYSPRQRLLCVDRLIREFPHKTREEIVLYEMWYCAIKYYENQRRVLTTCWKERKKELIEKMRMCYSQAIKDCNDRKLLKEQRQDFDETCKKLASKVREWRMKCLAAQEKEAEIAAREMLCQQAKMEEEERRQREIRTKMKEKVASYHSQKEKEQFAELARERERFERLRKDIKEQEKKNKKRVDYRVSLHQMKLQKQEMERNHLYEESKKREEALEKLRKLVRIEANADPMRLCSETKSSKAHSSNISSDVVNIRQPLFPMYSFTSEEIWSDKRIRVATALREAGLLSTEYARQILAAVPPPVQPRPDQNSSLFKKEVNQSIINYNK